MKIKEYDVKNAIKMIAEQKDPQLKMQQVQACNQDLMDTLADDTITLDDLKLFKDKFERFAFGVNSQMEVKVINLDMLDEMLSRMFPTIYNITESTIIVDDKQTLELGKEEVMGIVYKHALSSGQFGESPMVVAKDGGKMEIVW